MSSYLASKSVYDELEARRFDSFDTFLDDVVSVLILHTLQNIALQLGNNEFLLLEWNAL